MSFMWLDGGYNDGYQWAETPTGHQQLTPNKRFMHWLMHVTRLSTGPSNALGACQ